jgi:hypothetical protein
MVVPRCRWIAAVQGLYEEVTGQQPFPFARLREMALGSLLGIVRG